MNKTIITIALLLFGTVGLLEATECGGVYWYFSDSVEHPLGTTHNDPIGAVLGATTNCCAGSTITIWDIDTDTSLTIFIDEDGGNSSCHPE